MTLLLRSVLCLLAFAGLYHAAIPYFPFDHELGQAAGLALADRNRARARSYLESQTPPRVVLVGSSITDVLRGLPDDWYSLAQAGGTPLTGLHIVARHSPKPRWVFIETNRIHYAANDELLQELFDPHRRALLEHFPAFRERNRPSHIALLLTKAGRELYSPAAGSPASDSSRHPNDDVVQANLDLLAERVPSVQLDARIAEFQRLIDALRLAGTRVAFVEVPEHPDSYAAPLKRQLARRMADAFPASRYPWAPISDPNEFATSDGVHLDDESELRFAEQLLAWASTLPGWQRGSGEPETVASHGDPRI